MKFRTRLLVTFAAIVLLPLILTVAAFFAIGVFLVGVQSGNVISGVDYSNVSENLQNLNMRTEQVYQEIMDQMEANAKILEDRAFLKNVEENMLTNRSYILVRKGSEIYYTGNEAAAERIFSILPEYGSNEQESGEVYYFGELEKYARQIDFTFSDGSPGSFFIITMVTNLISRDFLVDMALAIIIILVVTSVMLTYWIHRGVFRPVKELNLAMCKIKEGDFDYTLTTQSGGEIGELYRNYEDMRLRLKENTQEQEQQERKSRELISNISHDLKTPITAVKGYVEGIMDGVADTPEKMDKYIKTIYNKANDMDRLINELTIYSGIDNNRIPYNFHRINVADYFGDCVEEVGLDLESRNIDLNYSNLVSPDTVIIADPEQMKKVINNIIGNSVKYMDKPKGIIDIRILDEMDSVRIEIEDNGKGISQKDLPQIFERFYRTDASRNSTQGGSGIGLSIVKKIIEDHGGYIWATSRVGEGTCIHFVIRKYKELQNA
ncbi:MAG: HAMP domain-containing histidine kinase [Lachnospiraceae bacterium]|nr:HAMP domain-containing histidine kinase [Lachnospiraceae bacterium]